MPGWGGRGRKRQKGPPAFSPRHLDFVISSHVGISGKLSVAVAVLRGGGFIGVLYDEGVGGEGRCIFCFHCIRESFVEVVLMCTHVNMI